MKLKQSHVGKVNVISMEVPDMIREEIQAEDMNTEMGPVETHQRLSNNKLMNTPDVIQMIKFQNEQEESAEFSFDPDRQYRLKIEE